MVHHDTVVHREGGMRAGLVAGGKAHKGGGADSGGKELGAWPGVPCGHV